MTVHRFCQRNPESSEHARHCEHDFAVKKAPVFMDTEGARLCDRCDHIDVLIAGSWIEFDEYLEGRRIAAE